LFHEDSYGYRAGKSAIEAVRICRERNWKHDWVLDVDIQKYFETIDHELLLKAVRKHCNERWVILYIERWLKAPIQHEDGRIESSPRGTPQGGVVSPLLANLYLHYAFDAWMTRAHSSIKFERYADDIVIHCRSEQQARLIKTKLEKRLAECHLALHPEKTKIVYCKDSHRCADYPNITYQFLGYSFRPRCAKSRKSNELFTSFLPAASSSARKGLMNQLRGMKLTRFLSMSIEDLAKRMNPVLRGWFNYFRHFYVGRLSGVMYYIDRMLARWVQRKYRKPCKAAVRWLDGVHRRSPHLFAHWQVIPHTNG
jgi:RNA-directed DNA polymerase